TSGSNIYYNNGSVGIGTTNPTFLLQVGDQNTSSSSGKIAIEKNNSFGGVRTVVLGYDSSFNFGVFDLGNTMQFGVNWAAPANSMYINYAGYVGIGTANPVHALHVAGTIGAEEVLVTSTGADYVF